MDDRYTTLRNINDIVAECSDKLVDVPRQKADGLTLGEAHVLILQVQRIVRANGNMHKLINQLRNKE